MGSVTKIWSCRNLKRGLPRHWVRFDEEMLIFGNHPDQSCVLSIARPVPGGTLYATLQMADRRITGEISRDSELLIQIYDLKLVAVVRAVQETRALVEFGVPRGNPAKVALAG